MDVLGGESVGGGGADSLFYLFETEERICKRQNRLILYRVSLAMGMERTNRRREY